MECKDDGEETQTGRYFSLLPKCQKAKWSQVINPKFTNCAKRKLTISNSLNFNESSQANYIGNIWMSAQSKCT